MPYIDGVSLTHGAAGSRQHIWSFAAARYETGASTSTVCPPTPTGLTSCNLISKTTIFATLAIMDLERQVLQYTRLIL